MFLGAFVSGLTTTPEIARANIRVLDFILALAALLLWAIPAVVTLRVTFLALTLALFILALTFAVPVRLILIFVNKGPATGSDRFRELGPSPGEPTSLNDAATTAEQVIV